MFKKLLAEAPPDAVERLLTPRRKFMYGMFAFAPGTLLGLFLYSVKRRMDAENERLREQHIAEQLSVDNAHESKDLLLANMIEDLRERLDRLEREARGETKAIASPAAVEAPSKALSQPRDREVVASPQPPLQAAERVELPGFLQAYEATLRPWLDRVETLKSQISAMQDKTSQVFQSSKTDRKQQEPEQQKQAQHRAAGMSTATSTATGSGIRERIAEREREMIAQDLRAYKQAQAAAQASKQP